MSQVAIRKCLLSVLVGLSSLGATASGVEPLRTVALSGTQAPGGAPGEVFGAFHGFFTGDGINLALNNRGEVAFAERSFYSEGGGAGLKLIARHDEVAPNMPAGVRFNGFLSGLRLLDDGTSYVAGEIVGPGIQGGLEQGVWISSPPLGFANLYRDQMTTGGFNAFDFSMYATAINQRGEYATTARLLSPGVSPQNNHSIWKGTGPQSLTMVVREGDVAPGLPPITIYGNGGIGGTYEDVFSPPQINLQGTIVFSDIIPFAGGARGIWSTRADGPGGVVAVQGEQAPGMTPGFRVSRFFNYAQNDANLVAFVGMATRPGPPETNIFGLWKETAPGVVELVAQTGQSITVNGAPLTLAGLGNSDPHATPGYNSHGVLSFTARLGGDSANNDILLTHEPIDGFRLIAREGAAAPGTGAGTVFGNTFGENFESFVLNKAGQVAFAAHVRGPGVNPLNDYGIWATDLDGNLRLVVREGDTIDVNDGDGLPDFREISSLSFASQFAPGAASTEMGRSSNFNDRGQIAFTARFTDGSSGVFVSDLMMIPEPGTAVMGVVAMAASGIALVRRRRAW
jgi:hypothetical protein